MRIPTEDEAPDKVQESILEAEPPLVEIPAAGTQGDGSFARAGLRSDLASVASWEAHNHGGSAALEIASTVDQLGLPLTLEGALSMLHEIGAMAPTSQAEAKIRDAKLARVTAHVHALGQGPKPPQIDITAFRRRTPPQVALDYIEGKYPRAKAKRS